MGRCLCSCSGPALVPSVAVCGWAPGRGYAWLQFPPAPSLNEDSPKRTTISRFDSCHPPSPLTSSPSGAPLSWATMGGIPPAAAPWSPRHHDFLQPHLPIPLPPYAMPSSLLAVGDCDPSKPSSFWKDLFKEMETEDTAVFMHFPQTPGATSTLSQELRSMLRPSPKGALGEAEPLPAGAKTGQAEARMKTPVPFSYWRVK